MQKCNKENFKWAIAMVPRNMVATCQKLNNFIAIIIKCGNGQNLMIPLIVISEVQVFQPLWCYVSWYDNKVDINLIA